MKRYHVGDLFEIALPDQQKVFFQYVCDDASQLGSNIIGVFQKKYGIDDSPDVQDILNGAVDFWVHVVLGLGINMHLWKFYANGSPARLPSVRFRISSDYGNPSVTKSANWWVWKVGEKHQFAGNDPKLLNESEIGIVVNPKAVVERVHTGRYTFFFPTF